MKPVSRKLRPPPSLHAITLPRHPGQATRSSGIQSHTHNRFHSNTRRGWPAGTLRPAADQQDTHE
ncbi:hypothetical protein, partial [Pseudovibrio sp. W64]|uniref:hypothetical protein n=1 Tax=Pseudovibrio sp. W64 TaxID=1735583 RepID=UPI0019D35959